MFRELGEEVKMRDRPVIRQNIIEIGLFEKWNNRSLEMVGKMLVQRDMLIVLVKVTKTKN